MNRPLVSYFLSLFFCILWVPSLGAADSWTLLTGESYTGEVVSPDARGGVIRKADGSGVTDRIGWTNFSQESLKTLGNQPKTKRFVESFIEPEIAEPSTRAPALDIKVKIPPRPPRPARPASLTALFSSGLSATILILLYLANLYAGFEAGVFRNYSPLLAAGVAAVLPGLGPLLFLCLPRKLPKAAEEMDETQRAAAEAPIAHSSSSGAAQDSTGDPAESGGAQESGRQQKQVFTRGQFTFNRRFVETKFAGFIRAVPADPERHQTLWVKSTRGEYSGNRIVRVTPEEIHLQLSHGGGAQDVAIQFSEITEIQIRPKEV